MATLRYTAILFTCGFILVTPQLHAFDGSSIPKFLNTPVLPEVLRCRIIRSASVAMRGPENNLLKILKYISSTRRGALMHFVAQPVVRSELERQNVTKQMTYVARYGTSAAFFIAMNPSKEGVQLVVKGIAKSIVIDNAYEYAVDKLALDYPDWIKTRSYLRIPAQFLCPFFAKSGIHIVLNSIISSISSDSTSKK